ncbi:UNVERIFIED_CONTAM: hypothetical protein Slati_0415500 [Sesamum latifolium]|uniref:Uncharacterized protein n=1 Tax=Sesamum latifolium TaxID=2727402 RepID=A0AAW2XW62_9LAMI
MILELPTNPIIGPAISSLKITFVSARRDSSEWINSCARRTYDMSSLLPISTLGYGEVPQQKVFVSRNAVFFGKGFSLDTRREELLLEESTEATPQAAVVSSSVRVVPSENIPILRRSIRVSQPPERYGLLVTCQLDNDPKTYEDALSDIDSGKWLEAMRSEMDSMSSNKIWTLVDPLKGFEPIGCKWVYKRKLGVDGR